MDNDKVQHLRNKPAIRFDMFKQPYNEYLMEEIATFSKGKGISKSEVDEDGKLECIRYGELYTLYREKINKIYSRTNSNNVVMSKKYDVITPSSGETAIDLATASCVPKDGIALGGDINIIRTQEHGLYLSYYLNSNKKNDFAKLGQGNSVVHIYNSHLKKLFLKLPSFDEQQKVAGSISIVDRKITLLEEKIENLKLFKRGFLKKYFTELESKGYEEVCLNDIATFNKGKGLSKSDLTPSGNNKCILYGELYTKYNEIIPTETSMTNVSKEKMMLSIGDEVLLPSSTTTTAIDLANATAITESDIILGGDINIIRGDFNNVFMAYYLSYFKKIDIARFGQGITIVHLYNSHLRKLYVRLPELTKQTQFSNKVVNFDSKIDHTEKKIEILKQFKKGLLQQMFI